MLYSGKISLARFLKSIYSAVLSPISGEYWFITAFIVFSLFIPLFRCGVKMMGQKAIRNCAIVMTIFITIGDVINLRCCGAVVDFAYVFILISYLKMYKSEWMDRHCQRIILITGIILLVTMFGLKVISQATGIDKFGVLVTRVFVNWNVILVVFSISTFWMFKKIKMEYNLVINNIASCIIGIYIFHENSVTSGTNSLLWCQIFELDKYLESAWFSLRLLGAGTVVFMISMMIAMAYKKYIERGILDKTGLQELFRKMEY